MNQSTDNPIPLDIRTKIDCMFSADEKPKVIEIIERIYASDNWGVGQAQLSRSLLVLSNGNLSELQQLLPNMEPRDIIMNAEAKCGNPGHYFIPPFESDTIP